MIRATPRVQTRARQIAAATGAHPVLSYATADAELPNAENVHAAISQDGLKTYKCGGCSVHATITAALTDPHCVNCGSEKLTCTNHAAKMPFGVKSDADMSAVQCGACNITSFLDNRVIAAVDSTRCTACGAQMKIQASSTPTEPVKAETMTKQIKQTAAAGPGVQLSEPGAAPENPVTLDAPNTVTDTLVMKTDESAPEVPNDQNTQVVADAVAADTATADAVAAEAEDKDEEGEKEDATAVAADAVAAEAEDAPKDEAEKEDAATEDKEDEGEKEDASADDLLLSPEDMAGLEELNTDLEDDVALSWVDDAVETDDLLADDGDDAALAAQMTGDEPVAADIDDSLENLGVENFDTSDADDGMSMVESSEGDPLMDTVGLDDTVQCCFMIQAGTKLLALKGHTVVASLSSKSKHADIMFNDAFPTAVLSHASQVGLRKGLKEFGFSLIRTKVQSEATVARKVSAATVAVQNELQRHYKTHADSLAIAAAGLARGLFKDTPNPIKAGLEQELMALGVRKPGRVASAFLAEYGMEYAKVLSSKAQQIANMSDAARKQIAEVLDLVSEPVGDMDEGPVTLDANTEEMPNNDYDYGEDASTVSARFVQPAVPHSQERQVAALLRPGSSRQLAATAYAEADANAVLSGNQPLRFRD